ncbi:hypothetical protein HMPREF2767_02685 [Nosocomiicoccus sp. HMSC067E10]|uniref:hypothetical protein n=1 Tax=Nosocomiicoccus sp. HMSC067E10 TaxID=1739271 RepID=UPI0008A18200|nr:hypothetical protein [Nosocomiicoccus sp. HMSC067E10]OFL47461.1 hypothetical protein HMPREF2767_02685 [Nosocomiicoccus sp. HMSC067E10]
MLYEFKGKYYLKNDSIIIRLDSDNKKYKLESSNISKLKCVIDSLNGFNNTKEIAKKTNLDLKTIESIVMELKAKNLIKIVSKNNHVFLTSDSSWLARGVLENISKRISWNNNFSELSKKTSNIKEGDLIVYINNNLTTEIDEIEQLAMEKKSNLLNVTLTNYGVLLGPLFTVSGGPCSQCLQNHNFIHQNKYSKSTILSNELYGDLIFNEVINIFRFNNPIESFEKVIEIDFSKLNIKKYEIYQIPGCKRCQLKEELY